MEVYGRDGAPTGRSDSGYPCAQEGMYGLVTVTTAHNRFLLIKSGCDYCKILQHSQTAALWIDIRQGTAECPAQICALRLWLCEGVQLCWELGTLNFMYFSALPWTIVRFSEQPTVFYYRRLIKVDGRYSKTSSRSTVSGLVAYQLSKYQISIDVAI